MSLGKEPLNMFSEFQIDLLHSNIFFMFDFSPPPHSHQLPTEQMRIESEVRLDYKDVLIRPKRSTLRVRLYIYFMQLLFPTYAIFYLYFINMI